MALAVLEYDMIAPDCPTRALPPPGALRSAPRPLVSMVVLLDGRPDPLDDLYEAHAAALLAARRSHEFLFVVPPESEERTRRLRVLAAGGEPIRIHAVRPGLKRGSLLAAASARVRGTVAVILPARGGMDAGATCPLVREVWEGADVALDLRVPSGAWAVRRGVLARLRGRLAQPGYLPELAEEDGLVVARVGSGRPPAAAEVPHRNGLPEEWSPHALSG